MVPWSVGLHRGAWPPSEAVYRSWIEFHSHPLKPKVGVGVTKLPTKFQVQQIRPGCTWGGVPPQGTFEKKAYVGSGKNKSAPPLSAPLPCRLNNSENVSARLIYKKNNAPFEPRQGSFLKENPLRGRGKLHIEECGEQGQAPHR
jgi:hypothetical protein